MAGELGTPGHPDRNSSSDLMEPREAFEDARIPSLPPHFKKHCIIHKLSA